MRLAAENPISCRMSHTKDTSTILNKKEKKIELK